MNHETVSELGLQLLPHSCGHNCSLACTPNLRDWRNEIPRRLAQLEIRHALVLHRQRQLFSVRLGVPEDRKWLSLGSARRRVETPRHAPEEIRSLQRDEEAFVLRHHSATTEAWNFLAVLDCYDVPQTQPPLLLLWHCQRRGPAPDWSLHQAKRD